MAYPVRFKYNTLFLIKLDDCVLKYVKRKEAKQYCLSSYRVASIIPKASCIFHPAYLASTAMGWARAFSFFLNLLRIEVQEEHRTAWGQTASKRQSQEKLTKVTKINSEIIS